MDHPPAQIENARNSAARKGYLHPFQKWLYKRREAPATLGDIYRELSLKSIQVPRTWTRGEKPTRIARPVAEEIERRWGYAATDANWPNGIKG